MLIFEKRRKKTEQKMKGSFTQNTIIKYILYNAY